MKQSRPNILLLYKTSTYSYYFDSRRQNKKHVMPTKNVARFKKTHLQHYKTLVHVEEFLRKEGVRYCYSRRGQRIDFSQFDFVITVGGDGTFLEAARQCTKQVILGINSDPEWSVGSFCGADDKSFPKILRAMLNKKAPIRSLTRLSLQIKGSKKSINVLNDVLICHANPAAMSRYIVRVNGKKEEQRSSGLWVATAAGSTGAIRSAGGKILPMLSDRWQYMPRELYNGYYQKHHLKGGVLLPPQTLSTTSLMNNGVVYVDGCHVKYPLRFADEVVLKKSAQPLKVIMP